MTYIRTKNILKKIIIKGKFQKAHDIEGIPASLNLFLLPRMINSLFYAPVSHAVTASMCMPLAAPFHLLARGYGAQKPATIWVIFIDMHGRKCSRFTVKVCQCG